MNNKIIIISPHCDDAFLSLGGYTLFFKGVVIVDIFGTCAWTKNHKIKDVNEIARMNYKKKEMLLKRLA